MSKSKHFKWFHLVVVVLLICGLQSSAYALRLTVVDGSGNPVNNYRWLVEEDNTIPVVPNARVADSLGVNIHSSHSPVLKQGTAQSSTVTINLPQTGRYMVSVLPFGTNQTIAYMMGGASVAAGQTAATVVVNAHKVPTAQILVLAHEDNMPLNNVPETTERGLGGFDVRISDAGGQITQDAFGNPLGTTYSTTGAVVSMGSGSVITCYSSTDPSYDPVRCTGLNEGEALIKNLPPGKYGIQVVPPVGSDWIQTATIEGTHTVDAWVKAGEPPFLFGQGAWHAWFSFTHQNVNLLGTLGPGNASISGRVINTHQSAPAIDIALHPGNASPECYIGLNTLVNGTNTAVYAAPCNTDSTFSISGVPAGVYELVMWDFPLDNIWAFRTVTVPDPLQGTTINLGDVQVNRWFGTLEGRVFNDLNGNAIKEAGEAGLAEQTLNLRFRDGTIYQSTVTDNTGEYSFPEVFPFFKWLVAEVDFLRYEATGAYVRVDRGGPLSVIGTDPANGLPIRQKLNPQPQPENGGLGYRTELGPVLTEGMILYGDQTNMINWGKRAYAPGANGGISGIVYYDTTRAPSEPVYSVQEPWEPGVPRVQVNLYQDANFNGKIDDLDGDAAVTRADIDNYPLGWSEGGAKGAEDVDRDNNGVFDPGDAINITFTDSWDDNMPEGCVDYNGNVDTSQVIYGQTIRNCAETINTWNQVRPALFDGGYAFTSYFPGGMSSGSEEVDGLPSGTYIVEAAPPKGYEIVKEEDKNVLFGDSYRKQSTAQADPLWSPPCVGNSRRVPALLSLFPGENEPAPYAGTIRRLCDMKQVTLTGGLNAAANFAVFTDVPKASRSVGLVANDLAVPPATRPVITEKQAVPWSPISYQDYTGREIARTYSDEFGAYNALLPSTYTVNAPTPSGVSPNVVTVCQNHPGPIPDPANPGQFITDPQFNPNISTACTNWDVWPGKTTYMDTPLIPVAAFQGAVGATLDCELTDGTPMIFSVTGPAAVGGPYVPTTGSMITILSAGTVMVPNPLYDSNDPGAADPLIPRDFGFGALPGSIRVNGTALTNVVWAADGRTISARVPAGATTGQLLVTRGDNGLTTPIGITLHVGNDGRPVRTVQPGKTIQNAINASPVGTLILIPPGTYNENVIMSKNVKLQGAGALSTIIHATPYRADNLTPWRTRLDSLFASGAVDAVPGQLEPGVLPSAVLSPIGAPGIFVLAKNNASFAANPKARIDGLTIRQAQFSGGGIWVNGYAHFLEISNNRILNNGGTLSGGIRLGTSTLEAPECAGYCSNQNDNMSIHHNQIIANGSTDNGNPTGVAALNGGGGGLAIFNGADRYQVSENFICGNFTTGSGGGIQHYGLSHFGEISNNKLLFNEASFGALGGSGGGIFISGEAGANATLTPGTGSLAIKGNLIQGNLAGAGLGGAIAASFINGLDIEEAPTSQQVWHQLDIFNNMIVNNVAGYAGAAISLQDTARGRIINNTIANNDSTATAAAAFPQGATASTPQAAGIVSWRHSATLREIAGFEQNFSDPVLANNILWHNRSWIFDTTRGPLNQAGVHIGAFVLNGFWDLQVNGTPLPNFLDPRYCLLSPTDVTGHQYDATNILGNPSFVSQYLNNLKFAVTPGEGGNFIAATFRPLTLTGNYHINAGSPAVNAGTNSHLSVVPQDYDGQARPNGATVDIGADEVY